MDGMKEIKMEVEEDEVVVEEPVIPRSEMTVMEIALTYIRELKCSSDLAFRLALNAGEVENEWIRTRDPEVLTLRRLLAEARAALRAPEPSEPKKKGPQNRGRARRSRKPAAKKQTKYVCPSCDRQAKSGTCLCNGCQKWFHLKCVGIRSSEYTEEFRCPECKE
ncbi:hypothetical protein CAEBREN_01617 [Caenorhabditis brenneri]|uniref:PHD-type domain-containing protein n=1 Tax=Caenorhabditis brenneri TaxID=135651 RepID=G0MN91_CAEBE|nr:hypothetical protein CAEBREN_01617 [Caenorhabditis brenneri]